MSLDEESLEIAANGGAIDLSKWPNIVEPLLERLQHNVYNVFPMPRLPPAAAQPPTLPSAATILAQNTTPPTNPMTTDTTISNTGADTTIEPNLQTPPRPAATSTTTTPLSNERIPDSQPFSQAAASSSSPSENPSTLPAALENLLTAISANIRTLFASKPPHTVQRLAELILRPTAHYRTLPAYLRAVDRVVSVTSPADIFPFQTKTGTQQPLTQQQQPNGATLNGSGTAEPSFMFSVDHGLGSDESLGGALLTPIPWLHNTASSPEGEGDQEPVGGVGVVGIVGGEGETRGLAAAQTSLGSGISAAAAGEGEGLSTAAATTGQIHTENAVMGGMEASGVLNEPSVEDVPHARGPPVVGVEDLGLQDGKGVEMNLDGASDAAGSGPQQVQQQTQAQSQESSAGLSGAQQQQEPVATSLGDGQTQEGGSFPEPGTDGDGDIALEDAKVEDASATAEKSQPQQQG
ncbi:uncharacterized protein BP01DRAFT_394471 [Aspergillus saccharolyticus JOP 1030-1]|uniref:Protein phosphatase 4 core regulatory subunit R2 n=1 Tax=Aspergillus saccharolyticus JOP 1030-1 TaxID=1450539 RepID=A0A318ZEQ1_9EURO|nr:hypothetical protein BP01DRAFT_394471 [Aspergillus saccharolyticus JOP 1030-1]PYH42080.1 hypothetical protein BP01DRAFT_394471 [Aspergillus saccharolyticus JOP 1030-1]